MRYIENLSTGKYSVQGVVIPVESSVLPVKCIAGKTIVPGLVLVLPVKVHTFARVQDTVQDCRHCAYW
jgi:hypothetical protein